MMLREQRVSAESLADCPVVSRSERGHRRLSLEQPEQAALRLTYSFGPFLLDPAERRLVRALELDPYGIRAHSHKGWHHFYAREYDLAIRDFQRTLTMEPNDSYSRRFLASSYEQKHMYSEAIAKLQKTAPDAASSPVM